MNILIILKGISVDLDIIASGLSEGLAIWKILELWGNIKNF